MAAHCHALTERRPADGPPLGYRAFVPPDVCRRHPLVAVYGGSRGSARQFRCLMPMAITQNVPLIVPTFDQERFAGYQTLSGADGPMAAHRALSATLDDVSAHLGIDTCRVDMLGFSGGAQFVHRYAMVSPTRVRRLVVASAGSYTFLDSGRPFPRGCGPSAQSGWLSLDVHGFLRLPVHVLVGEHDVGRDAGPRADHPTDRRQGNNRLARALRWVDHVEDEARARGVRPRVSFDLLPRTGHSFSQAVHNGALAVRTLSYLHPLASQGLVDVIPGQERETP